MIPIYGTTVDYMVKRKIIRIDEDKCTGCGECIPNCPEGALQVIDGKARLVSDIFCDGLGACMGECPVGAISVEEREAEPYDERKVMDNIVEAGENTIIAHLEHLHSHKERELLKQALEYLDEKGIEVDWKVPPGLQAEIGTAKVSLPSEPSSSELRQWPVQLHLLSPNAPFLKGADLLLAADCVAYSMGNFHSEHLKGKALAIACPKLDSDLDEYVEKLGEMIDTAGINTITVMMMEVPCCNGLMRLVQDAMVKAKRRVPVKRMVISSKGEVLKEEWVNLQ